ncbi:glycoside hydrolase family 25 protein [Enterococcus sp. DIV0876]|uniref:glycoside hydrolase family 25 protein n=1 Tax=Enterococcus sp. DIV0876 TaxID=2774633 RepID=UPI003D2FC1AF
MIPSPIIIDISEWQVPSKIDYDRLAADIDAVIVRIQYGENYLDKHYQTHIEAFKKRQVPVVVYAWVRGISIADMQSEAKAFWERGRQFAPTFWWLDVEEQSMSDMRSGCEAYRQQLKTLGAMKVGAYIANHLYSTFQLQTDLFDGIWLPTYGKNTGYYTGSEPTASKNYHVHQYTSAGRRAGYQGPLDLNRLVQGSFDFFFGGDRGDDGQSIQQPVNEEEALGGMRMKRFQLMTAVHLRQQPTTTSRIIATLKSGNHVILQDFVIREGYLWGEQQRNDKSNAYLALGTFQGYGQFV